MIHIDYVLIEEYSRHRLTIEEICAILDYPEDQFREQMRTDFKLKQAWTKGRALGIFDAAAIIEDTQKGNFIDKDKQDLKMKAALAFLDRHAVGWRQQK